MRGMNTPMKPLRKASLKSSAGGSHACLELSKIVRGCFVLQEDAHTGFTRQLKRLCRLLSTTPRPASRLTSKEREVLLMLALTLESSGRSLSQLIKLLL